MYLKKSSILILSEVKITYNENIHTFTTDSSSNNGGIGTDNTVGWFDAQLGDEMGPRIRTYTNISQ